MFHPAQSYGSFVIVGDFALSREMTRRLSVSGGGWRLVKPKPLLPPPSPEVIVELREPADVVALSLPAALPLEAFMPIRSSRAALRAESTGARPDASKNRPIDQATVVGERSIPGGIWQSRHL